MTSALRPASPSTDQQAALHGSSASQFLAAIPENPGVDDLAERFGRTMFWARRDDDVAQVRALAGIEQSVLDQTGGALATAASPLHLTTFGEAAMRTGFSPDSCRRIVQSLHEMVAPETLLSLGSELLGRLGALPEQAHAKLRKELAGGKRTMCRVSVKTWNTRRVVVAGRRLRANVRRSAFGARSRIRPAVMAWVEGVQGPCGWDAEFDRFIEIVQAAVERFLSWLARACGAFSNLVGGWTFNVDWSVTAELFEAGVDTAWAVRAKWMGAPAGRVALAPVGRKWPTSFVSKLDPYHLGLAALRDAAARGQIEQFFVRPLKEPGGLTRRRRRNWSGCVPGCGNGPA